MKQHTHRNENAGARFILQILICGLLTPLSYAAWAQSSSQQPGQPVIQNFWGGYKIPKVAKDPTKPVPDRSFFLTSVEPQPNGAKLIVDIYHGDLNSPVSLYLQVAVNDGSGQVKAIPFMQLDSKVADNPQLYYSRREFTFTYDQLNQALEKVLPAQAQHLRIGPGSPLFLFGEFHKYNHQWGSIGRGGLFFMPETVGQSVAVSGATRRPTELDLAYTIPQTMTLTYNDLSTGSGLKEGGQIRSRLESEGKFQIPLRKMELIRKRLFELANNPSEALRILGTDWKIEAELRYMKKDAAGNLILDQRGLPTPDPMVDTYYDNLTFDAAKKDMAIRYRWTEGNQTGAWNFKPGLTKVSPSGIVDRLEYGVDTTDDKPETVRKFADSLDPLNPFRIIRDVVPGATPSDFLIPAVKITDTRYKFKLKNSQGLVIELSLDDVQADSLRDPSRKVRYAQMEMDIDHLSTTSANVANAVPQPGLAQGLSGTLSSIETDFLSKLTSQAFLDGRPVIHTMEDLEPTSPVKSKHQADFTAASKIVEALTQDLLGKPWRRIPGAQKYAFAAFALEHVEKSQAPGSVTRALKAKQAELAARPEMIRDLVGTKGASCMVLMSGNILGK